MSDDYPPREPSEYRTRGEKQEKEEKERRDRQEKEEKGASDRPGTLTLALALIFAGLVLLAENAGLIPGLEGISTFGIILMGAGVIVGLEVLFRYLRPEYRRPLSGRLVLAIVLFLVGAGAVIGWGSVWPLILIGVGIAILVGALTRR
ncbi:MAG: hypothetical protein HPY83_10950 [Anaerolineae bacterium]|nr:hypothetical protein [Anaerolineae bacterium]